MMIIRFFHVSGKHTAIPFRTKQKIEIVIWIQIPRKSITIHFLHHQLPRADTDIDLRSHPRRCEANSEASPCKPASAAAICRRHAGEPALGAGLRAH